MTKAETVLKGLECCNMPNNHDDCPYNGAAHYNICTHQLLTDAIALLKERETEDQCLKTKCIICPHCDNCDVDENGLLKAQVAVKPKEVNMYPAGQYACGFCGHISVGSKDYHAKYCPECGKAVEWDANQSGE